MPAAFKQLLDEGLALGLICDAYKEEFSILDKELDYVILAKDLISKIIDKLPKKHIQTSDIIIGISGASQPNAYVWYGPTSLLVISKGILDVVENEDELAGLIAQKLMHLDLNVEFPEHANSKIVESMCDKQSIEALDQAGYRRNGLITLGLRLAPKAENSFRYIEDINVAALLDENPSWRIRIANLNDALAIYELDRGLVEKAVTKLPDFIISERNNSTLNLASYVEKFLDDKSYDSQTMDMKILILSELIAANSHLFTKEEIPYYTRRIDEINNEIEKLKIRLSYPKQELAFGKLVDSILALNVFETKFRFITRAYASAGYDRIDMEEFPPYGLTKELQLLINKFIAATDIADAVNVASQINLKIPAVAWLLRFDRIDLSKPINSLIKLTAFDLPTPSPDWQKILKKERATLPWKTHLQWSRSEVEIRKALGNLEVLEFVADHYHQDEIAVLGYPLKDYYPQQNFKFIDTFDYSTHDFKNDEIIFYYAKKLELTFEAERRRMTFKDQQAKALLVRWDLLTDDTEKFIKLYEPFLAIERNYFDGGFYFCEQVINKLKEIAAIDKVKAEFIFEKIFSIKGEWYVYSEIKMYFDGISLYHPFVQYCLTNEFSNDSINQSFQAIFDYIRCYDSPLQYKANVLLDEKANIELPALINRWLFHDYASYLKLTITPLANQDPATFINNLLIINHKERKTVWFFEVYKTFLHNPNLELTIDEIIYIETWLHHNLYNSAKELTEAAREQYLAYLPGRIDVFLQREAPMAFLRIFQILHHKTLHFAKQENIVKFERRIKELYSTVDQNDKQQYLEKLLFKHSITLDMRLFNEAIEVIPSFSEPDSQAWVIDEYVKIIAVIHGKDNGTTEYYEKVKETTEIIIDKADPTSANLLLTKFAEVISAQKAVSFFIRDQLAKNSNSRAIENGFLGPFAQYTMTELAHPQDKELRLDFIVFLLKSDNKFDDLKFAGNFPRLLKGAYAVKFIKRGSMYVPPDDIAEILERLYSIRRFFNSLSFETQILVIKQFLFPSEYPVPIQAGKDYVLASLFGSFFGRTFANLFANSLLGKNPNDFRNNAETQQIVEAYFEGLEKLITLKPADKGSLESREKLILSAMLIANARAKQKGGQSSSRGEALKQVLTAMGAPGRKLAQAIESHSDTPEDIKLVLKSSKTHAAPPKRWEVHEWAEKYYAPHAADGISSLGEILGAGAYGVTMVAHKNSGKTTAITFLRPYVAETSEDEFMILDFAAKALIKKNSIFRPFNDMQYEASLSSKNEVDMNIAALQQQSAIGLYEGLQISVGDHKFIFGVAAWIAHGPQYKETNIVSGFHFNDLQQSAELAPLRRQAAQAIIAAELYILLKGGHIDNDRHGGQQKISLISPAQIYIGNFDFGGVSTQPLTNWQKQLLGNIIGDTIYEIHKPFPLNSKLNGELLARVVNNYLKKYKNNSGFLDSAQRIQLSEAERFIGGVKRALLALGNYFSALESDSEAVIKIIISAVFATNHVDKIIVAGIKEKLHGHEDKLDDLASAAQHYGVAINYSPGLR